MDSSRSKLASASPNWWKEKNFLPLFGSLIDAFGAMGGSQKYPVPFWLGLPSVERDVAYRRVFHCTLHLGRISKEILIE